MNYAVSFLADLIIVGVVIAILLRWRFIEIRFGWLGLLLLSLGLYAMMLIQVGNGWLSFIPGTERLHWNWGGKIAADLLWLVLLVLLLRLQPGFRAADAGFTLKLRPGSLKPVLRAAALLMGLQILIVLLFQEPREVDAEDLLFQALMPGLDEEPLFRGVLLYMATQALVGRRYRLFGAPLNAAGLLLVLLFGLVHGIAYTGDAWQVNLLMILFAGLYGLFLLWIRERSGSLLPSVLTHNAVNLVAFLL